MSYTKLKHDLGILRQDASTKVGLILARDSNKVPLWETWDDEFLANQQTNEAGYAGLPVEKELRLGESNWEGGYGREFYDASLSSRYWQTYDMDMRFPNMGIAGSKETAITPPTLPTITNANLDTWAAGEPTGWTWSQVNGTLSQETTVVHTAGGSSAQIDIAAAGGNGQLAQTLGAWSNDFRSKFYNIGVWVLCGKATTARIGIFDNIGVTTWSSYHTGGGTWEYLRVSRNLLASTATGIIIYLNATSNGAEASTTYFDDVDIPAYGSVVASAEIDSDLLFAVGDVLLRVANADMTVTLQAAFSVPITDLAPFVDDRLYIALSDDYYYWYMSTAEAFTETDSKAEYFVAVGSTMWKATLPYSIYYSTTATLPEANWSAAATVGGTGTDITDIIMAENTIYIMKENKPYYRSSAGTITLLTDATRALASSTGGKNAIEWLNSVWMPYGTGGLLEYNMTTDAFTWRNPNNGITNTIVFGGRIVALAGDEEWLYAFMYRESGYDNLMAGRLQDVDGTIKWVWHSIAVVGGATCFCTISSVYAKCLWFGTTTGDLVYIGLPTAYSEITTHSMRLFQTSGYFITEWLHGEFKDDTKAFIKITADLGHAYSATVYFECHWQLWGQTSWTDAGDFIGTSSNRSPTLYLAASTSSRYIRFKFVAKTGSTTTTPILNGFNVKAILFPTRRDIIYCVVRCADGIVLNDGTKERDNDAATIKATLEEAKNMATWPVTIYEYGTGSTKYVRFLPIKPFSKVVKDEVSGNIEKYYFCLMQEVALS